MKESPETKIARLEERIAELHVDVSLIMSNHLPHIQGAIDELRQDINKINLKLAMWSGGIIVATWILEHYFQ